MILIRVSGVQLERHIGRNREPYYYINDGVVFRRITGIRAAKFLHDANQVKRNGGVIKATDYYDTRQGVRTE